ncbi:MAG: sensor histidine kinase [Anaerolineae bacterium]|jgi:signal transduction histidine kinase|nr:sensor histidine kinase [Anaerolineae bacterium]MBT7069473.1 sensor histidine kinase [Anaerolineae bacterium]MBT7325124.1 sensor histidine kinase [Anaerolineae bacterium]
MKELIKRFPFLKEFDFGGLSSVLTALAVAIPSLFDYFKEAHEYRWIALGLYFIFAFFAAVRQYALVQSPLPSRLYLGIQTIIVVSLLALPPHHQYVIILFFILSAEATTLQPNRNGYLWIFLFVFITTFALFLLEGSQAVLYSLPIYAGGYVFFGVFAASAARAEAARAESQTLLQDLREAHLKLQTYAAQAERLAVSEERNRLAREMHDTLGHRLTVAIVQLEGAERLVDEEPKRAQEMVATVKEQMRAALSELRSAVATLREPLQADLSLKSALKSLGENFQAATEIEVQMAFAHNIPELPNEYRVAIYRAAQESLTNVQRHAQAKHVRMSLMLIENEINLTLRDNGVGLPSNADKLGFGLRGIQERAAQLGGRMRLEANPEGGAQICLCLPIPSEENNNDA